MTWQRKQNGDQWIPARAMKPLGGAALDEYEDFEVMDVDAADEGVKFTFRIPDEAPIHILFAEVIYIAQGNKANTDGFDGSTKGGAIGEFVAGGLVGLSGADTGAKTDKTLYSLDISSLINDGVWEAGDVVSVDITANAADENGAVDVGIIGAFLKW